MCATIAKNELCSTKKTVLAINGSPRTNGTTVNLLDEFIKALPTSATVDRFDCYKHPPLPCNDCRYCHSHKGCILPDLQDFYHLLESSDGLVIATPVYNLSFPAPLKALIDRMQCYWAARFIRGEHPPIAREKRVALITTAGSDSLEGGNMLERQIRPVLTIINGYLTKAVHCISTDKQCNFDDCLIGVRQAAYKLFE